MKLACLGDFHLFRLRVGPWHLFSKRVLGQSNLLLNRRKHFRRAWVAGVVRQVLHIEPDAVLCSGDFTTTALKKEFEDAYRLLRPIEKVCPIYAVPGNHDRYTFTSAKTHRAERVLEGWLPASYPQVDRLNDAWDVMRLDSAVPRRWDSSGRIGKKQLEKVQALVDEHAERDSSRGLVVVNHYPCILPPAVHEHPGHALRDAAELTEILQGCRSAVVYVHGHIHRPWVYRPEDGAAFTSINAGAPVYVDANHLAGQGFVELHVPDTPGEPITALHQRPEVPPQKDAVKTPGEASHLPWPEAKPL